MPRHISVVKAMLIYFFAVFLMIVGFYIISTGDENGAGLMIFGFILAIINKVVFKVRTKQLEIDAREAIRDRLG